MRRECWERFPPPPISKETASWRSRHASRHVRDARAVMHVGIAHLRWRGKRSRHSRRMRTRNFTYLARGPLHTRQKVLDTLVYTSCTNSDKMWFNIKIPSYQYRKSHYGDKTVVRSSYLHYGISYTGKMSSLYWIGAQSLGTFSRLNDPWFWG